MDKVVIITGAGSGIGLATAKYLQKKGCKIYGTALHERESPFPLYVCDVTDTARMKIIFEEIFKKEGRIDAVINNAGYGISGAAEHCEPERVKRFFDVDLCSVINLSAAAIPYLRESGGGNIINIGSVTSLIPIPFQACYSAAKAGVENFSRALACEIKDFNIKVTCVLPGDTATGFTAARIKHGDEDGAHYNGKIEKSVAKMEHDERNGKSPVTVAKAVYKALKKKRPPLRITVGASYKFIIFLTRILPLRLVNFIIAKLYT